jgi:hypothetical protein
VLWVASQVNKAAAPSMPPYLGWNNATDLLKACPERSS